MNKHTLIMYILDRALKATEFSAELRKVQFDDEYRGKILNYSLRLVDTATFLMNSK